jgi:formylglycine-generating enzyme required for sulfatase activity
MGSKEDNSLALGDEKPQHTVDLSHEYWIGKYPVTNAQFVEFVKASGYRATAKSGEKGIPEGKENHPVVQVSWKDAQAFCGWLTTKLSSEISEGFVVRLPTEAEWEKAARGEYGNEWPWGNDKPDKTLCNVERWEGDTTPVGKYSPHGASPYGAQDMAGNVWEWCLDWYDENEYARRADSAVTDPRGPESGTRRVVRGGSWRDDRDVARCAYRNRFDPGGFFNLIGFRLVLSPI